MFKKVTKIALAGVIGVSMMVGSSSLVSAKKVEESVYGSEAKVKFIPKEGITLPVDPSDLDKIVIPDDEGIRTGTEGELTIDYASHFIFGDITKTSEGGTYHANPVTLDENLSDEYAPYVQVTDERGSNTGWTLKVKQPLQLNISDDEERELKGAEITIGEALAQRKLADATDAGEVQTQIVTIKPGEGDYEVFGTLGETTGGTFLSSFGGSTTPVVDGKEDVTVTLNVLPGTVIESETYQTDLEWTLYDTPDALD